MNKIVEYENNLKEFGTLRGKDADAEDKKLADLFLTDTANRYSFYVAGGHYEIKEIPLDTVTGKYLELAILDLLKSDFKDSTAIFNLNSEECKVVMEIIDKLVICVKDEKYIPKKENAQRFFHICRCSVDQKNGLCYIDFDNEFVTLLRWLLMNTTLI